MQNLHKIDMAFFKKYINILFLPSLQMNEYVNFPKDRVIPLPSGGDIKEDNYENNTSNILEAIYVGSLHDTAGTELILESFNKINTEFTRVNLTFVCREKEFIEKKNKFNLYKEKNWLKIKHLKINELDSDYLKSDFAVIPYLQNIYNNFAMPVKLFEYFSYGLPILSTKCIEIARFIEKSEIGITANDNVNEFVMGIEKMIKAINMKLFNRNEIQKKFKKHHTWLNRVETINQSLINLRK